MEERGTLAPPLDKKNARATVKPPNSGKDKKKNEINYLKTGQY